MNSSLLKYIEHNIPESEYSLFYNNRNPLQGYLNYQKPSYIPFHSIKHNRYVYRKQSRPELIRMIRILPQTTNKNTGLLWIKFHKTRVVCYWIHPKSVKEIKLCCSYKLCDNVKRYSSNKKTYRWYEGTLLNVRAHDTHMFIHDIFIFNGQDVSTMQWTFKKELIHTIVNDYIKTHPKFDNDDYVYTIREPLWVSYKSILKHKSLDNNIIEIITDRHIYTIKSKTKYIWFDIEPLWYQDGYVIKNGQQSYKLMIQTLKQSQDLNSYFRRIREQDNLDLLEESEDDEDFENTDKMKWVKCSYPSKIYCKWNHNFKSWEPVYPIQVK